MDGNICIIAPTIPPDFGGGGRRMLNQAVYLAENGYKISLITNTTNYSVESNNLNIKLIELPDWYLSKGDDNKIVRFIKTVVYQPVIIFKLFRYLFKLKPEVVHLVNSLSRLSIYSILITKFLGIKVINSTTLYGSDDPVTMRQKYGLLKNYIFFKCPDAIVSNSPLLYDSCKRYGLNEDGLFMIPNPVDTEKFAPINNKEKLQKLKGKYNVREYENIFLTVSVLKPRKNIEELIKVFNAVQEKYPNSIFLIAGPTELDYQTREYHRYLKRFVVQMHLGDNVRFLGEHENVDELMQISDFFIFASTHEGMPNVVLEAMSTGLPIVLKEIDGISQIMFDQNNGLTVNTTEEFVNKLLSIVSHKQKRIKLSKNARHKAESYFSNDKIMKKYVSLYSSLIKCHL